VVEKVRVDEAVPPGGSMTLDGLTPQPGHEAQRGGAEVESVTVPLKPFTLVREIVEVAEEPAITF